MAKVNPGRFVREVRQETAKVVWPTRKEIVVSTIMVMIFATILGTFFMLVDQVLDYVARLLFV